MKYMHMHEQELLRWQEIADLLPEFIKINIGIKKLIFILHLE
ncbi:hypothetical protein [Rickettsia oklahomensis]|uniref:Transposase n=1 Tax=Rickettsia oklahomensis TaxID=3141789 RepID=A0AAU7C0J8_9RICK